MAEPTAEEALARAKQLQREIRQKRAFAARESRVTSILVLAIILVWGANRLFDEPSSYDDRATVPAAEQSCTSTDAGCLGHKLRAQIQYPCTLAVESLLTYQHEWTDGMLDVRFDAPTWYVPSDTIIFTGSKLLVSNVFNAKQQVSYFCVVDATTGVVRNAGIPSLDARLSP